MSRRSKLITLLLIMILIAASMLIVNQQVINQRIYKVIGTTLQDWVQKETIGLYSFSYDSLSINTLKEQITLRNVKLRIDSSRLSSLGDDLPDSYYRINSPRVFLDLSSIWNVIFNNKLDFKKIKVDQPSVTVYNIAQRDSSANLSLQSGNLYLKLNKYLDEFNIETFFLEGGEVTYYQIQKQNKVTITDIDLYVDNLVVDANKRTAETDRIRVVLKKPSFMLADGIHKIQMDSLLIDSKYQTILLNEVFIFPDYEKLKESDLSEINLYNFSIPNIHIDGINFTEAYRDNVLDIDRITIPNPEIIIDTHKNKNKNPKKISSNSLPILLSQLFSRISTQEFIINDAKMDFAIEANDKSRSIKIDNTSVSIIGLELDTLQYNKKNNHIKYDQLSFELKDSHLILPDSIHELYAGNIFYHSDSSNLKITDVEVYPKDNNPTLDDLIKFQVKVPLITLKEFKLKQYVQDHSIDLSNMHITSPTIVINQDAVSTGDSLSIRDFNFALPDDRIASHIKSQQIHFSNIKFSYIRNGRELLAITDGNINFSNFFLHTVKPGDDHLFNSNNVYVSFAKTNISHKDFDLLELTGLEGSLNRSSYTLGKADVHAKDGSWALNMEKVKFKDFDVQELLMSNNVYLDSLIIGSAELVINTSTPSGTENEGIKSPVKLNYFEVDNGEISLNNSESITTTISDISGKIHNLHLIRDGIQIDKYSLSTGEIKHNLTKGKLMIGAHSSLIDSENLILNLPYISPIDTTMDNAISMGASQLSLTNYDLYLLLNDKRLISDELKILSTSFEIQNHKSTSTDTSNDLLYIDWQEVLKDKLKEIKINRIIVSGPELELDINNGKFATEAYQIELNSFNTSSDGRQQLLNSNNIRINVDGISYKKKDLQLLADQFNLNENRKLIAVKNLSIEKNNIELTVPLLFAKKLNLKKLAEEQKLIGNELEIAGFTVSYTIREKNKDLHEQDKQKGKLPFISFNEINAHQGSIKLTTKDNEEYIINNVRGQLSEFDTESNELLPLFAKSVDIKASDLTGFMNDRHDKIVISGIHLANSGKKVTLKQLKSTPVHEKIKYAYQIGHETDWINLVIDDIDIHNFDLYALLSENTLAIDNISARNLTAGVYRDKKLPFPEENRPPLPQTALRELGMLINIDTVNINNANIKYQELSEQAFEPGELKFSDLNIILSNITNMPDKIADQNNMFVRAMGKIEGTDISANISFDLTSENDEFRFIGKMGEGNLEKFNKIMEKNIFLRINKGYSKGLTFNIRANNDHAMGLMQFNYRNLKVSLLDKQTNKTSGLDESLASFFANTFVINSNNPSFFVLKEGDIYFKRDKSKSLFNYWAKAFLSGIVSSIGVKNNKKQAEEALNSQEE